MHAFGCRALALSMTTLQFGLSGLPMYSLSVESDQIRERKEAETEVRSKSAPNYYHVISHTIPSKHT